MSEVVQTPVEVPPQIPPKIADDLQAQLTSVKMLVQCHQLIQDAPFPYAHREVVAKSLMFLQTLHSQVMASAKAHPDAHLVEELKTAMEAENAVPN